MPEREPTATHPIYGEIVDSTHSDFWEQKETEEAAEEESDEQSE